jgi:hypothetical protein
VQGKYFGWRTHLVKTVFGGNKSVYNKKAMCEALRIMKKPKHNKSTSQNLHTSGTHSDDNEALSVRRILGSKQITCML